ncbi:type 1 glutamine amidotransferase [Rhodobacter calidifons]|uniref:Type 1 glutamine amidotransferase n=1 Tax=Rhodobacter calidifons TaxID=2715277 RepID=A0ABX0GAC9_9RHOB|nr:type 1 glutamine amidotransferase [Rhodobacter calidifons]NHB77929.1 type 1 glutamine amidotransferase [Rhodobacter calidifons]
MHIAVLATNTDDSDFAARHPRDVEKFKALLQGVRPGWRVTAFDLPKGEFPDDLQGFDGALIGGSPASVHDGEAWIDRLMQLIRDGFAAGVPLAGACFGHQAIAKALGGTVGPNPGAFVLGTAETRVTCPAPWMEPVASFRLAAAHGEQVTALPPGAEVVGVTPGCPAACYRIGNRVFATQYHPEMTLDFLAALVEEFAPKLPDEVGRAARDSLSQRTEGPRFAEWIARFFEQAKG